MKLNNENPNPWSEEHVEQISRLQDEMTLLARNHEQVVFAISEFVEVQTAVKIRQGQRRREQASREVRDNLQRCNAAMVMAIDSLRELKGFIEDVQEAVRVLSPQEAYATIEDAIRISCEFNNRFERWKLGPATKMSGIRKDVRVMLSEGRL